ncbi:MAG: acetyl-CoA carboxylase biotin carboxyl carrier protein subunit, partial [Leucobacter sp.]|nr:acetyl-CoA carboxylase biotin carboxyl carrier protein subunit [Leucobacter sp.]
VERRFAVQRTGSGVCVTSASASVTFEEQPRYTDPSALAAPGSLLAPMPGTVIRVAVAAGDTVEVGQPLIWVEAMKMEHTISATADGVLDELRVAVGDQVDVGMLLAVISGTDADAESAASEQTGQA